jgi:hypothetical protein
MFSAMLFTCGWGFKPSAYEPKVSTQALKSIYAFLLFKNTNSEEEKPPPFAQTFSGCMSFKTCIELPQSRA